MSPQNRISSIDIARGIAIVLMIEAHLRFVISIDGITSYSNFFAAPFFTIVAGIGFQMFLSSRERKGLNRKEQFSEALSRASILFGITLLPSLIGGYFFPSIFPEGIAIWSVFQVIAIGYIIGFTLSGLYFAQIASIFIIIIATPIINMMDSNSILTNGIFPVFPFIAYFFAGQLISGFYLNHKLIMKDSRVLTLFAAILAVFASLSILLSQIEFDKVSRGTISYFITITSIQCIIIISMIILVDRMKFKRIFAVFDRLGRIAFSAYYIHFVFILATAWILSQLSISMIPLWMNPALLLILISLLVIIEKLWRRHNYFLGLEWILRTGSVALLRFTHQIIGTKEK